MADSRILFLVVGRGGSKGLAKKNLRTIGGLPLVGYKAQAAALADVGPKRVICSTDDDEIAAAAARYGAEVPFMRPPELATDTATSASVVLHAMDWITEHDPNQYDAICLLEPSSPFATAHHLEEAIRLFRSREAGAVVGVTPTQHPSRHLGHLDSDGRMSEHLAKREGRRGEQRRQDVSTEYVMNGAFYIAGWDYYPNNTVFLGPDTYGFVMPREYSVDIDEPLDLVYAEFLVSSGLVDLSHWPGATEGSDS